MAVGGHDSSCFYSIGFYTFNFYGFDFYSFDFYSIGCGSIDSTALIGSRGAVPGASCSFVLSTMLALQAGENSSNSTCTLVVRNSETAVVSNAIPRHPVFVPEEQLMQLVSRPHRYFIHALRAPRRNSLQPRLLLRVRQGFGVQLVQLAAELLGRLGALELEPV